MSQVGLNGVDNGAIRFTHVRIPRENLLDRFASVDRAGRYSSPLPSAGKRFAATLGELTGGRVGLTAGSLGVLKVRQQELSWDLPDVQAGRSRLAGEDRSVVRLGQPRGSFGDLSLG